MDSRGRSVCKIAQRTYRRRVIAARCGVYTPVRMVPVCRIVCSPQSCLDVSLWHSSSLFSSSQTRRTFSTLVLSRSCWLMHLPVPTRGREARRLFEQVHQAPGTYPDKMQHASTHQMQHMPHRSPVGAAPADCESPKPLRERPLDACLCVRDGHAGSYLLSCSDLLRPVTDLR
jgi:hypothetical protein